MSDEITPAEPATVEQLAARIVELEAQVADLTKPVPSDMALAHDLCRRLQAASLVETSDHAAVARDRMAQVIELLTAREAFLAS